MSTAIAAIPIDEAAPRIAPDVAAMLAEERSAYLAGLRALEALLGTHTDLPLPNGGTGTYFALRGSEAELQAEVNRIAVILRVTPVWDSRSGHYMAELPLGGGVRYLAMAVFTACPDRTDSARELEAAA